jgi:hypothetical protein
MLGGMKDSVVGRWRAGLMLRCMASLLVGWTTVWTTMGQPALGPVIDVAGTWETSPEENVPNAWFYRLNLERIGQTNFPQYVDMAYRGTLSIGYTAVWIYQGGTTQQRMECTTAYDLGGYVRSVYDGGTYRFFMNGTNYVQILPNEPPTPLRINFSVQGPTTDLREGKLPLSVTFSDRRGIPISSNTVDICGEAIHHVFSDFSRLRRAPAVPEELRVVGNIHGHLYSDQQTTTEETNAVHRAEVFLYQQDDYISKRRANQTEEEYAQYLAQRRARRLLLAHKKVEAGNGGFFSFYDLPVYRTVLRNGNPAYELARYMVEVRNAETDEEVIPDDGVPTGATEVLYFATGEFPNIIPDGEERPMPLHPFDGIGAKRSLAEQLSEIAPINYKGPEDRVLSYLALLEQMPVRSEQALEGLRRALWAERVTRDAALFAKELNGLMIEGFANLVGDILEDVKFFNRRALRNREETMEVLESNLTEAANKGFKTPLIGEMREELTALRNNELGIISDVSKHLKTMVELMLSGAKAVMIAKGVEENEMTEALGVLEFTLNSILNLAISQSAGGLSESAKVLIKKAQDSMFDGPGFSYSGRTADLLQYSETRMQTWSTVNESAYQIDRERAVRALEDLGSYATLGTQIALMTSAASDGISTTESVAGALSAVPPAKVAEMLLKIAKYVNNLTTFGIPAWLTLHEIPKLAREGAMGAYGETVLEAHPQRMSAQSLNRVQYNYLLGNDVSTKTFALNTVLKAAAAAIQTNDFPRAMTLLAGTNPPTVMRAERELQEAIEALLAQARGSTNTSTNASRLLSRLMTVNAETRDDILTAMQETAKMALEVYRPKYASTIDPVYLARRNRLVTQMTSAQNKVNDLSAAASPVSTISPRLYPVVMANATAVVDGREIRVLQDSPQEFTVRARLQNISTATIYNEVSARLKFETNANAVTLLSPERQVIGRMDYDNGIAGEGTDEVELTWICRYEGSLSNAPAVVASVEILENTNTPASFLTYSNPLRIEVAAPVVDTDHDGIPDDFERLTGLDPTRDDARLDLDGDGLSNEAEYFGGTLVHVADSDGDGLSDFEESRPGRDRLITNPLVADSDGDGLLDGEDPEPLVAGAEGSSFRYAEPELVIRPSVVYLSATNPLAQVEVSSRSGEAISWTALAMDEALINVVPKNPDARPAGELLISSAGYAGAPTSAVMVTSVKVIDLLAGVGAERDVLVVINSTIDSAVPVSVSVAGDAMTLSWTASSEQSFVVQYSDDLQSWINSPDGTFGTAVAGQIFTWRDEGVPGTPSSPRASSVRFYRVLPIAKP